MGDSIPQEAINIPPQYIPIGCFIRKEDGVYCEGDPNYYGLENVIMVPQKPAWYYDWDYENSIWILNEKNQAKQEAIDLKATIVGNIRREKGIDMDDELALIRQSIVAITNGDKVPQEYTELNTLVEDIKTAFATKTGMAKYTQVLKP